MKLEKSNPDIQNNDCSNCGVKTNISKRKLLGFRSNKVWKKILSISYLIVCAFMIIYTLFSGRVGKITLYDFGIDKAFSVVLCICFMSPYFFLSNTKIRDKLPLFKKHTIAASTAGMAIILFFFMIVIGVINSLHSNEYKADMENHAYIIENETKATCTEDGKISYLCEYCGIKKAEHISAIGHKMVESSRVESTCTKKGIVSEKCTECEHTKTYELDPIAHIWNIIEDIPATCHTEGSKVSQCSNCNQTETITTEKIEHVLSDDKFSEATCTQPKQIHKKCNNCTYTEVEIIGGTLPHTLYTERIVEATCIQAQQNHKKCQNCTYTEIETIGETAPHTYGEWFIEKEATTQTFGTQSKLCSVCQHKITEKIKKLSPITFSSIKYSKDYLGGVEWDFEIKSNSQKTIKYIRIYWDCYNAVGDLVKDQITGKRNYSIQITGPIEYGSSKIWSNQTLFYNYDYDHMKITKIEVEFMDSTVVRITDKEYSNIFAY